MNFLGNNYAFKRYRAYHGYVYGGLEKFENDADLNQKAGYPYIRFYREIKLFIT